MKLIISGTACIGKSTVFNELKGLHPTKLFLNESARELFESGAIRSVGMSCSHKDQLFMLEEHYKNTLRYDDFISDRGVLDAFVYATQNYLDGAYSWEEHLEHERIFLKCIKQYDVIYYIPLSRINIPLEKDGLRNDTEQFRKDIDRLFQVIIKKYDIKTYSPTDQIKESYWTAKNVISDIDFIIRCGPSFGRSL